MSSSGENDVSSRDAPPEPWGITQVEEMLSDDGSKRVRGCHVPTVPHDTSDSLHGLSGASTDVAVLVVLREYRDNRTRNDFL